MDHQHIILFDGECNLCNRSVQFVLKHDKKKKFMFGSLQSEQAKKLIGQFDLKDYPAETIIYLQKGKLYTKSAASLRIAKELGGIWKTGYALMILPRFIRDAVYNFIAKHRYKWFGRRESCYIPTPELKNRFIDQTSISPLR